MAGQTQQRLFMSKLLTSVHQRLDSMRTMQSTATNADVEALAMSQQLDCKHGCVMLILHSSHSQLQHFTRPIGNTKQPYLGEISGNQSHAYSEVCLIKVIWHIPAQLAILASLLDYGMEKCQHPHQWPECLHSIQDIFSKCVVRSLTQSVGMFSAA